MNSSPKVTCLLPNRPRVITLKEWDAATLEQRDTWLAEGVVLRDGVGELQRRTEERA